MHGTGLVADATDEAMLCQENGCMRTARHPCYWRNNCVRPKLSGGCGKRVCLKHAYIYSMHLRDGKTKGIYACRSCQNEMVADQQYNAKQGCSVFLALLILVALTITYYNLFV